jgi:hypothetical protein
MMNGLYSLLHLIGQLINAVLWILCFGMLLLGILFKSHSPQFANQMFLGSGLCFAGVLFFNPMWSPLVPNHDNGANSIN